MSVEGPSLLDARIAAARGRPTDSIGAADDVETRRLRAAVRTGLLGTREQVELGRFTLEAPLGAGGMGVVYRAHDRELDRSVAIKLLHRRLPDVRLRNEARALARLDHPNIVRVYDVGTHEGRTFLVMQLVEGHCLASVITRERPPLAARLRAFAAAAAGLQAAHRRGIVHRDFKAANVLVGDDGIVRVADFGLACPDDDSNAARAVVGTLAYASPEQRRGEAVDVRADVYAFSTSLYEAVYDRLPDRDDLVFPRRPRISRALREALRAGLCADVEGRSPDLTRIGVALDTAGQHWRRSAPTWFAAALVIATATVAYAAPASSRSSWCLAQRGAAAAIVPGRQHVDAALATVDRPWAPAVARRVLAEIDGYTERLEDAWSQACVADTHGAVAECLRSQERALGAVVEQLKAGDATVLLHASEAIASLEQPARCLADDDGAGQRDAPHFSEIRARARLALSLESTEAAELAANELLDVGRRERADGIEAEALLRLGGVARLRGRSSEAWQQLEAAYFLASAADRPRVAIESAAGLLHLAATDPHRLDDGQRWARHAHSELARAGHDPLLLSVLRNDEGSLHRARGEFDAALVAYRDAEQTRRDLVPLPDQRVGLFMQNRANVLFDLGRKDDGLQTLRAGVEMQEAALGVDHPALAQGYNNLGAAYMSVGDLERADEYLQRAMRSFAEALGERHPQVARVLSNLGSLAIDRGAPTAALSHHQRALELLESALGPDHLDVAIALGNLATAQQQLEMWSDARASLARSLAIRTAVFGPKHAKLVAPLLRLAAVEVAVADPREALRHTDAAWAIAESDAHRNQAQRAAILARRAAVALALGRHDEAIELASRVSQLQDASDLDAADHAEALFVLARALRNRDPSASRSNEYAVRARALFAGLGPRHDAVVIAIDGFLAGA